MRSSFVSFTALWLFEKGLSDCDAYGNPYWAVIKGATQERCQVDSVALELPGGEWPGDLQTSNESNTVWAFEEDNGTEQKTVFVAIFWFKRRCLTSHLPSVEQVTRERWFGWSTCSSHWAKVPGLLAPGSSWLCGIHQASQRSHLHPGTCAYLKVQ